MENDQNTELEVETEETPETAADGTDTEDCAESLDYEEELNAICSELPELCGSLTELTENGRYAELRALGLTPKEAYLATAPRERHTDNRSHLTGAVPRGAAAPQNQMSRQQLDMARSIFGDLDDGEIRRLYKKVTK